MFWLVARIVVTLPPPPLGKELTGETGHSTAQHYPLVWQGGLPRKINLKCQRASLISHLCPELTTSGKLTSHISTVEEKDRGI